MFACLGCRRNDAATLKTDAGLASKEKTSGTTDASKSEIKYNTHRANRAGVAAHNIFKQCNGVLVLLSNVDVASAWQKQKLLADFERILHHQ